MKALVFSDSHGRIGYMSKAVNEHKDADTIIFLGDGESDLDIVRPELTGKSIIQVRGNCDYYSLENETVIPEFFGTKVYVTHGFRECVKYGFELLLQKAHYAGAKLVLYGHTHSQHLETIDSITLLNPGSIADGCYATLEITYGNKPKIELFG